MEEVLQLGKFPIYLYTAKQAIEIGDFLAKKYGFTGVEVNPVGELWEIEATGREPVVTKARKLKGSTSSEPSDVE